LKNKTIKSPIKKSASTSNTTISEVEPKQNEDTNKKEDIDSSDEESMSLSEFKSKQQQKQNTTASSTDKTVIDWKPVVESPTSTSSLTNKSKPSPTQTKPLNKTEEALDKSKLAKSNKKPSETSQPAASQSSSSFNASSKLRRSNRVIESSSSSSSASSSTSSSTSSSSEDDNKNNNEAPKEDTSVPATKSKSTSKTLNEDAELIFTPKIKYEDKSKTPITSPANAKSSNNTSFETANDSADLTKSIKKEADEHSNQEENEGDNEDEPSTRADRRRSSRSAKKPSESDKKSKLNDIKENEPSEPAEAQEESESSTNRSLRSNLKTRSGGNLNTSASTPQQSKRRSLAGPSKLDKYAKLANSDSSTSLSTKANLSETASPSTSKTTDSGLLSIIKGEPIQISASSTISPAGSELNNEASDANFNETSANAAGRKSMEASAPFSSSSISSNSSIKFEDEKAYKAWKKSIMLVHNNIAAHKHATVFMNAVKDEIAPGYSNVVLRPMDLGTIKKNIENGSIKSTCEFQRDIMLMFTNAIMYNSSNHDIHKISLEMYKEVLTNIEVGLSFFFLLLLILN
jgi:hypothetical protein